METVKFQASLLRKIVKNPYRYAIRIARPAQGGPYLARIIYVI